MTGVTTQFAANPDSGAITVYREQDVEPILERTKALHNAGEFGSSEMRHAATIPAVVVEMYCNTAGITLAEFMQGETHVKRLLNDPALSAFRVWRGAV